MLPRALSGCRTVARHRFQSARAGGLRLWGRLRPLHRSGSQWGPHPRAVVCALDAQHCLAPPLHHPMTFLRLRRPRCTGGRRARVPAACNCESVALRQYEVVKRHMCGRRGTYAATAAGAAIEAARGQSCRRQAKAWDGLLARPVLSVERPCTACATAEFTPGPSAHRGPGSVPRRGCRHPFADLQRREEHLQTATGGRAAAKASGH